MPHIVSKVPITVEHERYDAAESRFEVELENAPTYRKKQVLSVEIVDLQIAALGTLKQEQIDEFDAKIAYWETVKTELQS